MAERKKTYEWLVRGVLTKVGDLMDRKMGRETGVRSSLATSELSDRLRNVLDANARDVPGKGMVVPHNLQLKMQWDKFSDESQEMMSALEAELTIAAVDHINDSLYRTFAPVRVKASRDYFTEDVKLTANFGEFDEQHAPIPAADGEDDIVKDVGTLPAVPDTQTILVATVLGEHEMVRELDVSAARRVSIGRAASNGLMIDDASVSKIHATVALSEDGSLSVADTGSTNGTFVGGERIAFGTSVPLSPGEKVTFGTIDVQFALLKSSAGELSEQ